MVSCNSAVMVADVNNRIVHANEHWTELTGYCLDEAQGSSCSILEGSATNRIELGRRETSIRNGVAAECTVYLYRKDGRRFLARVIVVPLKGGFESAGKNSTLF